MTSLPSLMLSGPLGPHPPLALLRQYAAGTLPPEAQHRVEAHTLACARCADVLAGLLQTDADTTDATLLHLRGRLRQRVASAASRAPRRPSARPSWLGPQLAAAVALLLTLLAGGWWAWQHRAQPAASAATQSAAPAAPAPVAVASGAVASQPLSRARAAAPARLAAPPAPTGGYPAFTAYLRRAAAAYAPAAGRLAGRVRVGFGVGADGRPAHPVVRRGLRPDYDAQALRLLQNGPRWQGQGEVEVEVIF